MDAQPEVPESDLFCESIIQTYVNSPRFVKRGWLVDEMEAKLAVKDCRFLLLTAQPGAGKSAFCAWLASHQPEWPRYFIRRDQRMPFGDAGARSFLLQIGFQLAAKFPDAFRRDELRVTIEQRVKANLSGDIVGAEVDRLLASPFRQKIVDIRQQVDSNEGRLTSLRVGEWVTEPRLLALSDLQYMALINPATTLLNRSPGTRLVILVDALDELRYRDTSQSLLHWLAACPPLPANVRVVLTARRDEALLAELRAAQRPWLQELVMEQHKTDVAGDLQAYADRLAGEPAVRAALKAAGREPTSFVDQLTQQAAGNLGYLVAVARAVDQAVTQSDREALQAVLDLTHVPPTLEGLYAFSLGRIRDQVRRQSVELEDPQTGQRHFAPAWPAVYRPTLGVLSVAREPLTPLQIQRLGRLAAEWGYLAEAMVQLRQFLDPAGDGAYRLYHSTLAEFLSAESTRQNLETAELYLEPAAYHRCIVHAYAGCPSDWKSLDWPHVDAYGVRNLVAHAAAAGELHEIQAIYGRKYLERKREVQGSEIPLMEEAVEVVLPRASADEVLGVAYNVLHELRPNSYRALRTLAAAAEKTRDLPDLRRRLQDSTLPLAEMLLLLSEDQPGSAQKWRELKTRVDMDKGRKAKERDRDRALLFLAWGLSGQAELQANLLESYKFYTQAEQAQDIDLHALAWYAAEGLRELGPGRVSQQTVQALEDHLAAPVDLARSTALYILSRWGRRTPAVAQALRAALTSKRSYRLVAQAADAARLLRGLLPEDEAVSGLISILSRGAEEGHLVVYRPQDPWNYARRRALRALGDYAPADASLLNKLQEARAQLARAPAGDADAPGIAQLLEVAARRIGESVAGAGHPSATPPD